MKTKILKHMTAMISIFLFLIAFESACQESLNPNARGKVFSVVELSEDLQTLWAILDEGHGGLERYTSRDTLKKSFDEAAKRLIKPLTEIEFYRMLLPLIAEIKDGHTSLRLSPTSLVQLNLRQVFLPFELRFIGAKAYIFRNLSAVREIADGTEILAINDMPMSDILPKMLAVIHSDAGILSRRLRILENPIVFGTYFSVLFGETDSFSIRFQRKPEEAEKITTVPAIRLIDIFTTAEERYPASTKRPLYELGYRGSTAVITIRGFGDDRSSGSISYPNFIQKAFQELAAKKIETLIIDLRGNGGGTDEYGRLLFAHFMDQPFRYYKALEVKKNQFDFSKYIVGTRINLPADRVQKNSRGWYDVLNHPNVGLMKPEIPLFTGRTCILIDGLSFSTTGETTSLFHFHKKAVFLGEECGAGYYGNTSGYMPLVTLPKTGLQLKIPLILYTLAVEGYPPDRGIVPDIPVTPTISDLLAGRDPVMERALAELSK